MYMRVRAYATMCICCEGRKFQIHLFVGMCATMLCAVLRYNSHYYPIVGALLAVDGAAGAAATTYLPPVGNFHRQVG